MYDMEDFRRMIGLGKEEYTKISMFQSRILEVAQKQINQYSDLKIRYQLIKNGRQFSQIKFIMEEKAAPQIHIDYQYNEKQARAKLQLEKIGIVDEKLVSQILTGHLDEFFKWNHGYQTGKFQVKTSASGHLLRTLGIVKTNLKTGVKTDS